MVKAVSGCFLNGLIEGAGLSSMTYSDENCLRLLRKQIFCRGKTDSANNVELCRLWMVLLLGLQGLCALGMQDKIKHRCGFSIAITKNSGDSASEKYLMEACIECAREAGYLQLELEVVAENERAVEMYREQASLNMEEIRRLFV